MTIWKFPLVITDRQQIGMPQGASILHVDCQNGTMCLWAVIDSGQPLENREFLVVGTGHSMPEDPDLRFLGTVLMGPFVWHVFEVG